MLGGGGKEGGREGGRKVREGGSPTTLSAVSVTYTYMLTRKFYFEKAQHSLIRNLCTHSQPHNITRTNECMSRSTV